MTVETMSQAQISRMDRPGNAEKQCYQIKVDSLLSVAAEVPSSVPLRTLASRNPF